MMILLSNWRLLVCGDPTFDEDMQALIILWFSLIDIASAVTLYQCYKKQFLDTVLYRKHCRFWFTVVKRCLFADILYRILSGIYRRLKFFGSLDEFTIVDIRLFSYILFFVLVVFVVSFMPATLQNWYGKQRG